MDATWILRRGPGALLLALLLGMAVAGPVFAADPTGAELMAGSADPNGMALTFVWMIVCGVLVFFMQAGFGLVEAGFAKSKNTVNIWSKNYLDFCIGGLAYFFFGYGLMYGTDIAGLIGSDGFLLLGEYYDVEHARDWFFQMVFAATAATIVSGALSERTRITAYMAYSFLLSGIVYPLSGHWVWGGGWLAGLGFHDFAGSGVVHMVGGFVGLIGARMVGPRNGKYNRDGTPNPMPPHNATYIVLGGLILFVGWFGFNAGSTLSGTDLRMSIIVANTMLAAIAGSTVLAYQSLVRTGKVSLTRAVNGSLAGLVAITAPCGVVAPWAAMVIGGLGGLVLLWSESFIERTLKIDDPVGAVSVHGVVGLFGVLAVGIFADGSYAGVSGLIAGNFTQIGIQALGGVVLMLWALIGGGIMFALIKAGIGLRASDEEQETGLDMPEHGMAAYRFES